MIQFNLLPDIKIQYLKARRQKHLVMLISTVAIIFSIGVLALLISVVFGLQKKNISDLNRDINDKGSQLQGTQNLNRILTVQNQLTSLPALHSAKPVATRLYGFITQVTPTAASISHLTADFQKNAVSITGAADSLSTVNTFADALKFATYHTVANTATEKAAFSNVVLSSFGRDDKGATYTIIASFKPALFNEQSEVTLTVPNITTRTNGGSGALFKSTGVGR